jgi:hypothetical protein
MPDGRLVGRNIEAESFNKRVAHLWRDDIATPEHRTPGFVAEVLAECPHPNVIETIDSHD